MSHNMIMQLVNIGQNFISENVITGDETLQTNHILNYIQKKKKISM